MGGGRMARSSFSEQQKRSMLAVIGILVAARFAGVPLIEHQTEKRQQLNMVTQQLERATRLVEGGSLDNSLTELQESRRQSEEEFLRFTNTGDFRLQAQQRIQQIVQQQNTQVNLFDWLTQREELDGYLRIHQARVILEGPSVNVVQAQLALVEEISGLNIVEYAIQPQRRRARSQGDSSRVTLVLEVAGVQR